MIKLNALLLATLSVVAATSVQAADSTSSLTREQVTSEYHRAVAAGEVPNRSLGEVTLHANTSQAPSTLTRADVQAEYLRAKMAGEIRVGNASVTDFPAKTSSTLTRAEVFSEYQRARSSGELAEISNAFGLTQFRQAVQ